MKKILRKFWKYFVKILRKFKFIIKFPANCLENATICTFWLKTATILRERPTRSYFFGAGRVSKSPIWRKIARSGNTAYNCSLLSRLLDDKEFLRSVLAYGPIWLRIIVIGFRKPISQSTKSEFDYSHDWRGNFDFTRHKNTDSVFWKK